jgi:hypothetical protein
VNKPKILLLDCETAPNLTYIWGLHQELHTMDMFEKQWYILCVCCKWLGENNVMSFALPDFSREYKKDKENDLYVMKAIWKLLDEADVVVGHNSVNFDIKKIFSRFAIHNITPPSPFKQVDTLLSARKHFDFTSNKLADLSKILGLGAKIDTNFELWRQCMLGNQQAWNKMIEYCKNDVVLLEKVYLRLLPYMNCHPNLSLYIDDNAMICPNCASKNIQLNGFAYTAQAKYQRVICKDCGTNARLKKNLFTKEKIKLVSY